VYSLEALQANFEDPFLEPPTSTKDHPLGSAGPTGNYPNSDFSQVAPPSALAEEDPNLEQEDSVLHVETVFDGEEEAEEDAENPDDPSLSDLDEALTAGVDESSFGDSSNFAAAPNLQKMVQLELGHCHVVLVILLTRRVSKHTVYVARRL
jgi:hypothetical protein